MHDPAPPRAASGVIAFLLVGQLALTIVFVSPWFPMSSLAAVERATRGWITVTLLASSAIGGIGVVIALRHGRQTPASLGWRRRDLAPALLVLVAAWLLLQAAAGWAHGGPVPPAAAVAEGRWGHLLGPLLAQLAGTALMEETLYRAFLWPQLRLRLVAVLPARSASVLALIASQAIFALMHIPIRIYQGAALADLGDPQPVHRGGDPCPGERADPAGRSGRADARHAAAGGVRPALPGDLRPTLAARCPCTGADAAPDRTLNAGVDSARRCGVCVLRHLLRGQRRGRIAGRQRFAEAAQAGGDVRRILERAEAAPFVARRDRAADQRVLAERAGALPASGRDDEHRCAVGIDGAEAMAGQPVVARVVAQQLQRLALVPVPEFVGIDGMPAADLAGGEQVVDRRRHRARTRFLAEGGLRGRFVDAAVAPAFDMRLERELARELFGSWIHPRMIRDRRLTPRRLGML